MMKIAIITCGMLPIPAVQGGAVENLIDYYLEYNNNKKLYDITVFSPWNHNVKNHPALCSDVNHYIYIDVTSFKAKIQRRIYKHFHSHEYYNYFIEYYFERVYKRLRNNHYDYILLENSPGHAYKLSRRGYHNLILHLHNDLLNSKSRFHECIANSLTKVITVSDFINNRVSTIVPKGKIQTVYNGIDIHQFSVKSHSGVCRQDLNFSDEDFIIVYSGRINKDKGISELIDAILLLKDMPNIKLMILGSSFFDDTKNEDAFLFSLKKKARQIDGNIVFTGFIPYSRVPDYLHLADIAVLPSMWEEPFGLTIVEAMASGLPLITTKSGGIPEICEGAAILIDREHIVNHLAKAIRDLYEHPEKRRAMALASSERAKSFSKEDYAAAFFYALQKA